jgi:hypothetical protein
MEFVQLAMHKVPQLQELELRLTPLLDYSFALLQTWLPSLTQLQSLALPSTPLTPHYLALVSELKTLKHLTWVNAPSIELPGRWETVQGKFPSLKSVECVVDKTEDALGLLSVLPKQQLDQIDLDLWYPGLANEAYIYICTICERIAELSYRSLRVLRLNLPRDIQHSF